MAAAGGALGRAHGIVAGGAGRLLGRQDLGAAQADGSGPLLWADAGRLVLDQQLERLYISVDNGKGYF